MNPLLRLLRFALPHKLRVLAALPAMVLYALASGGLAYIIKPIFDESLPAGDRVGLISGALVGLYLVKGAGAYFSVYLMADAGQRLVHDLRTELFQHMLGQSTAFFGRRTTGRLLSRITSDVSRVQQVVSETCGDLIRESLALTAFATLLFYHDARLALVCMTGAPVVVYPLVRLGQHVRQTTRRSQEQVEYLSHVIVEALTGHRIVQAFQAEPFERQRFARASRRLYRTIMRVTSALSVLPPVIELLGGRRHRRRPVVRQPGDRRRRSDAGRVHVVHDRAPADVRSREEAEPGQCEHSAGHRRGRTDLRDSGHPAPRPATAPAPPRCPRSHRASSFAA